MSEEENERPDERRGRELIELLNELRVALPGVQMLFGFLLALPFSVGSRTPWRSRERPALPWR